MNHHGETASTIIARFASGFSSDQLDQSHIRQCGIAFADTFAVAIAGAKETAAVRALKYARLFQVGGNQREAAGASAAYLWGQRASAGLETAALYNGILAHVLDYDDVAAPMSGHPSVALFPSLFALAEARDLSGRDVITAYVVGFEVMCRMGRALSNVHYQRGWHLTSSLGAIGSAVACCHLLKLGTQEIQNAIGLAVAQTAGTRQNFNTDAKAFQGGACSAAGLRAALLAETGFGASVKALDGPMGFTSLYSAGEGLTAELLKMGKEPLEIGVWGIEAKQYPACYVTHRAITGIFELRKNHHLRASDIDRIEIETSAEGLAPLIGRVPVNGLEGKFSIEYIVALAIIDGEVGLSSFTDDAVSRPEIRSLMRRVTARETDSPMLPRWTTVKLVFSDGSKLEKHIENLRGGANDPLTLEEMITKVTDCLRWAGSRLSAPQLIDLGLALNNASVRQIVAELKSSAD